MAVLVGLGVLTVALLFAADHVEDVFGTPLTSPRALDGVIFFLVVGVWNAIPATLAAVLYEKRIFGGVMAIALALVSPACVLYAANEVAHDPDGWFIYVDVPFWPIVCTGVICIAAMVQASRRDEAARADHHAPDPS